MANVNSGRINILQWNCRSILRKKHFLQNLLHHHDIRIFALSETHLSSLDDFSVFNFNIVRRDREDGFGGVLLGIRKDISFRESINGMISSCELVGAAIADEHGCCLNVISGYSAPNCRLNTVEVGNALKSLTGPLMVVGDFNAHSQSWGCREDDARAGAVLEMADDLNLVVLNDGSITRIAAPPRRSSAIDLTFCSSELSLDITWRVLDDPAGSDHLPIISSLNPTCFPEKFRPNYLDLTKNISWARFSGFVSEGIFSMPSELNLLDKYELFIEIVQNAAKQSQPVGALSHRDPTVRAPLWWDAECMGLDDETCVI
jgi:exonuclease III